MFLDVELLLLVCCIPRSPSSPVIFFLVFSFLIYNPFFLLLFLFEVSPLSLYVPSSSVVWFLLLLTGIHPTPYLHFKDFQSCNVLLSHSPYFCTVQGHTSNQCFHHSFLEASSFFSILPLVIFPPGKGFFPIDIQGRQSWGLRVDATSRFWAGGRREGRRGSLESWTGREILYLIMYRKYVRKWLLLKRNRIIWPEVAVNGQFFAWKI